MIKFLKTKDKKQEIKDQNIIYPQHVLTLDQTNFNEFIKKYPLSLIDFWAPWCNPCKTMLPRLRRIERIYQGKIAIGRINIQQNNEISKKYDIMSIPYYGFFKYGKKIGEATGEKSISQMKKLIENYISKK